MAPYHVSHAVIFVFGLFYPETEIEFEYLSICISKVHFIQKLKLTSNVCTDTDLLLMMPYIRQVETVEIINALNHRMICCRHGG
ncbi:unnamed protein product [Absidia cylindrospora]